MGQGGGEYPPGVGPGRGGEGLAQPVLLVPVLLAGSAEQELSRVGPGRIGRFQSFQVHRARVPSYEDQHRPRLGLQGAPGGQQGVVGVGGDHALLGHHPEQVRQDSGHLGGHRHGLLLLRVPSGAQVLAPDLGGQLTGGGPLGGGGVPLALGVAHLGRGRVGGGQGLAGGPGQFDQHVRYALVHGRVGGEVHVFLQCVRGRGLYGPRPPESVWGRAPTVSA